MRAKQTRADVYVTVPKGQKLSALQFKLRKKEGFSHFTVSGVDPKSSVYRDGLRNGFVLASIGDKSMRQKRQPAMRVQYLLRNTERPTLLGFDADIRVSDSHGI